MESQGQSSRTFPKINSPVSLKNREHDTITKLKGSFVGENVNGFESKSVFSPPNITAFN